MAAFQKFDVQAYLRGEYKPPIAITLVSLGTLGRTQGNSAFTTASSSTEGHLLTINASGVPTFSHLQGGTF
jgi:hypothetical protein